MDVFNALQAMLDANGGHIDPTAAALLLHRHMHEPGLSEFLGSQGAQHPQAGLIAQLHIQLTAWLGNTDKAKAMLVSLLEKDPACGLGQIEWALRQHAGDFSAKVEHTYLAFPNSAMQSLGFFRHQVVCANGVQNFITKFSMASTMGFEPLFHEAIRPLSKGIQAISPATVLFRKCTAQDLCLLTMEYCEGVVPEVATLEKDALQGIVNAYQVLLELPIARLFPHFSGQRTKAAYNHGYLAMSMHRIHEERDFMQLTDWVLQASSSRGYQPQVVNSIQKLVGALREQRFHERIIPEIHYSFLHGDLHRHNVLLTAKGPVFIDWARCTIGPKQIDLAALLRRRGYRNTIDLLRRAGAWERMDPVNQALFAIAMIVVSLMIDLKEIKEEPPEWVFLPAMEDVLARL